MCSSAGPQTGGVGRGVPKSVTDMYADGGDVGPRPCSGVHQKDCEYYAGDHELGKLVLKNAIQRHTSEDDLTESMLGKSRPEMASHGLVASSGASNILGDIRDSLFKNSNNLEDSGNKKLSRRAIDLINKMSLIPSEQSMQDAFLKETIRPAIEKMIGKTNTHIIDAVISAISHGEIENIGSIVKHAAKVCSGHRAIDDSIESLFSGGIIDQSPSEKDRDKLKKFIKDGGINAQIMNQSQAMTNHTAQAMAGGGEVDANAPQDSVDRAFPEQAMLMSAVKGGVNNYLQGKRPDPGTKMPFDIEHKNIHKEKDYNTALDVANKPLVVLQHIQNGSLLPEHMQHMGGMYPDLYNHISKKITERVMDAQIKNERPSYRIRQGMSLFLGSPLDSTMTPQAIQSIQSIYAPQSPPQAPGAPKRAKKDTAKMGEISKDHFTQSQATEQRATQWD